MEGLLWVVLHPQPIALVPPNLLDLLRFLTEEDVVKEDVRVHQSQQPSLCRAFGLVRCSFF